MRQQQRAVRRIAGPEEEGLLSEVTAGPFIELHRAFTQFCTGGKVFSLL